MNTNKKPSGKMKGSQKIVIQGDAKGAKGSKSTSTNPKSKVMAKVMSNYPNKYGAPSPQAVVSQNISSRDGGKTIPSNAKRSKFIGR